MVILFTLTLLSLLSFFRATGTIGVYITQALSKVLGWGDWTFPVILLILCYQLLRPARYDVKLINYIGLTLTVIGYSGLLHLPVRTSPLSDIIVQGRGGGYLGFAIGNTLLGITAFWGTLVILLAVFLVGLFIFLNTSFNSLIAFWQHIRYAIDAWLEKRKTLKANQMVHEEPSYPGHFKTEELQEDQEDDEMEEDKGVGPEPEEEAIQTIPRTPRRATMSKIDLPIDLLTSSTDVPASGDIKASMKKIEEALKSFGIEVTMGEVNVGPTVTQYTLKPVEGVKLNQITALHNDLSLALAAHPIRIEAPIPGKSLVGIEVPNSAVSLVKLREVLQSNLYINRRSNLMVALGKDVTGKVIMADLEKMPHLLIAGATGSGKSVCINSMIISLLYQNSPDILKLILVDPKRVELTTYDGIPHLVTPVITDIEKTINALRWAVHQMEERYKLIAQAGKKNIQTYNEGRLFEKMPYLIIIIDELADMMMVAAREVESAVIRLAQMSRAVGIHLILATQRPSVNVITGLIKANITSRIAFAVASATDSRTIIDSSGAEKLLGNGDMLYISAELSKPKRIQGAFVSDEEIAAVTGYLREHGEPQYEAEVTERRHGPTSIVRGFDSEAEEGDVLQAAEVVVRAKRASATLLQSRMRIGFAKASRILDILEERGIIGPQNSSKPRDVLITEEELKERYGYIENGKQQPDEASPDTTQE